MKCDPCGKEFDCNDCVKQCERKDTATGCICPECQKVMEE